MQSIQYRAIRCCIVPRLSQSGSICGLTNESSLPRDSGAELLSRLSAFFALFCLRKKKSETKTQNKFKMVSTASTWGLNATLDWGLTCRCLDVGEERERVENAPANETANQYGFTECFVRSFIVLHTQGWKHEVFPCLRFARHLTLSFTTDEPAETLSIFNKSVPQV